MPLKPSAVTAPKPIGVAEDVVATAPVLPPASPQKSTASAQNGVAEHHGSFSRQTPSPRHRCQPTHETLPLPAIVTGAGREGSGPHNHIQQALSSPPRVDSNSSSGMNGNGNAIMNGAHRNSTLSDVASYGSFSNAGPSVPSSVAHCATLDTTTVPPCAVLEDFATATTLPPPLPPPPSSSPSSLPTNTNPYPSQPSPLPPTPTSQTKARLAGKPPMMNPTLFTQGTTDASVSPFHGHPTDAFLNGGASGGCGVGVVNGYAGPTSPAAMSTTAATVGMSGPTTPAEPSRTNLIVYNIGHDTTEETLHGLFDVYGDIVSCAVMREIHTGESLGTAFVRFATNAEARRALYAFNDRTRPLFFNATKPLVVQWARKQHDDTPIGDARKKIMKLFVRNVPLDCSVDTLEALFGQYGCVRQVTLHKDTAPVEDAAMERLIAFVIYTEEGAAERAATAVHNTKPFASCYGVPIMIKLAENSQRRRFFRNADGTTTSAANSPLAGMASAYSTTLHTPMATSSNYGGIGSANSFVPTTAATTTLPLCGALAPQTVVASVPLPFTPTAQACGMPMQADTFPSSYQMPLTASPFIGASADATTTPATGGTMTTGEYGLSNSPLHASNIGNNGSYPKQSPNPSSSYNGGGSDRGVRRTASYTKLPFRNAPFEQHRPHDCEDAISVDSLTHHNTHSNCGGGFTRSPTHSRHHTANSLDASLTDYGTDRTDRTDGASVSSKSTAASAADSAPALSLGPHRTSPQSWISGNDSSSASTNVSVHGAMVSGGYQITFPGGSSRSASTSALGPATVELRRPPSGQPSFHAAPNARTSARRSLPSPAVAPTASSNRNSGNGNADDGKSAGVPQYVFYPGKTQHNGSSGGAANTSLSSTAFHNSITNASNNRTATMSAGPATGTSPGKLAAAASSSGSTSGNTSGAITNNSSNSSTTFPQGTEGAGPDTATEASANWRRAVRTHTQQKRQGDTEASLSSRSISFPAGLGSGFLDTAAPQQQQQQQQQQPTVLMVTSTMSVTDAIEVVPKASPPKSPSAGVNPRLAAASDKSSTQGSGAYVGSGAAVTNSASLPRRRYYNNPYCPESPKMYC